MRPGNVLTARVGPILEMLIEDRWPEEERGENEHGGYEILAEKTGCDRDTIASIVTQRNEGVGFDLVDRLFCALGRPDVWRGELANVYESIVFVQTCAIPSCGKTFPEQKVGYVKKYCSPRCATLAHGMREGRCTGERLRKRGVCLKGHKMTPENTRVEKRNDGRSGRVCKTCQREYQREWARKRRATDPRFVARKREAQRKWRQPVAA